MGSAREWETGCQGRRRGVFHHTHDSPGPRKQLSLPARLADFYEYVRSSIAHYAPRDLYVGELICGTRYGNDQYHWPPKELSERVYDEMESRTAIAVLEGLRSRCRLLGKRNPQV